MYPNTEKNPRPRYTVGQLFTDWDGKTYTIVSVDQNILVVVDQKGEEKMILVKDKV